MDDIESRLATIEERNRRVETDKAWETSEFRVATIAVMTYVVAVFFMRSIGVGRPWLNACVPVLGFILSTRSLPFIKRWWLRKRRRDQP